MAEHRGVAAPRRVRQLGQTVVRHAAEIAQFDGAFAAIRGSHRILDQVDVLRLVGRVTGQAVEGPVTVVVARALARVGRQVVAVLTDLRAVGASEQ